ncbi:MAG: prepilin-type N-terminal cleavage/methylation domain-containing protein [Elusimicrobiota bacterium]
MREHGFTLIELIVVIVIVGILAAVSLPQYTKSIESSRADDAAATVAMLGRANRMFRIDNGRYAAGDFPATCAAGCPNPIPATPPACAMLQCKYLPSLEFVNKGYTYRVIAAGAQTCGLTFRSPAKTSTNSYLACAKRCTGASPCTNNSTYASWGYAVDTAGVVHSFGLATSLPPEH